jgi:hypothetical protein
MREDIKELHFNYVVSKDMKMRIPEKELGTRIVRELSRATAQYIFDNFGELPITYSTKERVEIWAEEHRMSFCMISHKELKRLLKIEQEYCTLQMPCNLNKEETC